MNFLNRVVVASSFTVAAITLSYGYAKADETTANYKRAFVSIVTDAGYYTLASSKCKTDFGLGDQTHIILRFLFDEALKDENHKEFAVDGFKEAADAVEKYGCSEAGSTITSVVPDDLALEKKTRAAFNAKFNLEDKGMLGPLAK
jgi:hypothetical protein